MSERWTEIVRAPQVAGAQWVALPENGWGAVVAYCVGPGRARPHAVPREDRLVTEIRTDTAGRPDRVRSR